MPQTCSFSSLNVTFVASFYSSRLAGRPCAVPHQTTRINTEVRYTQTTARNALPPAARRENAFGFKRIVFDCDYILSAAPPVLDRVLESTSMKEKMAKYQAAVIKQGGTQPVSSQSTTEYIILLKVGTTLTSCVARPYLCAQPSKLPRLDCLPSSCLSLPVVG